MTLTLALDPQKWSDKSVSFPILKWCPWDVPENVTNRRTPENKTSGGSGDWTCQIFCVGLTHQRDKIHRHCWRRETSSVTSKHAAHAGPHNLHLTEDMNHWSPCCSLEHQVLFERRFMPQEVWWISIKVREDHFNTTKSRLGSFQYRISHRNYLLFFFWHFTFEESLSSSFFTLFHFFHSH